MPRVLDGIRVIELGVAIAGPLAARHLGQLGAEVLKIESRSRGAQLGMRGPAWAPPDLGLVAGDLMAGNNTHNNGKRSIGIELKTPEGRALLDRLIEQSDVFITNFSVPAIESLSIDYTSVRSVNPTIVYMSMPGYGSGPGPYQHYRSWGPNLSSFSGLDHLTGDPDRPPIMTPVPLPDYVGGYHGLVAVLAALNHRRLTGEGQWIDLSQFEATVAILGPAIGQAGTGAGSPQRMGNRSGTDAPHGIFPSRIHDRWVAIAVESDYDWEVLGTVAGHPDWANDQRFSTTLGRMTHEDELEELVGDWTSNFTPLEVVSRLQAAGVAAAPVQSAWEHLSDPQLQARRYWRIVKHDWLEHDLAAAPAFHFSETPVRVDRASPAVGEGNQDVLSRVLGMEDEDIERLSSQDVLCPMATLPSSVGELAEKLDRPYWQWAMPMLGIDSDLTPSDNAEEQAEPLTSGPTTPGQPADDPTGALHGLRVLDMSSELSAYGTKLLVDLGADVVRIEPPEGSALRRATPTAPDGTSFTQLYVDGGKRSVTLDLDTDDGRERFQSLVSKTDVLYEGLEPGSLARHGFSWEELQALNPRLVLVSVTPFGQTGPYRDWKGEDLTLWAMSGMVQVTGYPDRRPLIPGAHLAYYFIGSFAAAGALAAIHSRALTGRGQWVDVSGHEVLMEAGGTRLPAQLEEPGVVRTRTGSRALGAVPYGYYQCKDKLICLLGLMRDHWQAIAEWIHEETGITEVLDERFTGSSMVRANYTDEIESYINALAGLHDAADFCVEAQRRGIPAAPVNPIEDTLNDPHLDAQNYWVEVDHPELGIIRWPGAPYRLSATKWRVPTPAPALGQHNDEVFGPHMWGEDPEEITSP